MTGKTVKDYYWFTLSGKKKNDVFSVYLLGLNIGGIQINSGSGSCFYYFHRKHGQ